MSLPTITATGHLGRDPELKFTHSGKPVAEFSLGCDESRKGQNGEWEKVGTTWLKVAIWGPEGESVAEYLVKGDKVTVTGSLTVREYEAKDGTKGRSVEVKYAHVSKHLPRVNAGQPQSQQPAGGDPWSTQTSNQEPPF